MIAALTANAVRPPRGRRSGVPSFAAGWLFGRFGVADAMYAPVVFRFRTYGVNIAESAVAYARERALLGEAS